MVGISVKLSLNSGGNAKFDLKFFSSSHSKTISGVDNQQSFQNFENCFHNFYSSRLDYPLLSATTLLIPGYVNLDHKNLDREKLFIEDSNIIEGRNFNAASGFLMGILPRLPKEEYCAWWNKHKDFMNIIGVVSRSVTSYRDSDFTTICRKLKTCMTDHVKITGHKIKVYKGHGMKARIMMYNFVDLDSISSDKKLAMDDVFETIIDLTEE